MDPLDGVTTTTDLAGLLASFPVPTYERGNGVITGTVAEHDGTPLAGVQVTAVVWGTIPGVDYKEPGQTDLRSYILQEIEQYHFDRAFLVSAWTDADGHFTLDGIRADRDYHLRADREHWIFDASSARHITAGKTASILAMRSAPVTVEVRRDSGTPEMIGYVVLSEKPGDPQDGQAGRVSSWPWDHRSPTLDLPVDYPYLRFIALDRSTSDVVEAGLVQGVSVRLTLTVTEALAIRGTVQGAGAAPVHVSCVRLDPGQGALGLDELYRRGPQYDRSSGGRFAFMGLEAGRYQVSLHGQQSELVDSCVVDLASAAVEVVLEAPPLDSSHHLLIVARGPDGQPAKGVRFEGRAHFAEPVPRGERYFGRLGSDYGYRGSLPATTTEPGSYRVDTRPIINPREDFDDDAPLAAPPTIELMCTSPEHGVARVQVAPGSRQAEVTFIGPTTLSVEVTGITDWGLRNRLSVGTEQRSAELPIGTRERVSLGAVAPGPCAVTLRLQGRTRYGSQPLERLEVDVRPGENIVQIPCPPLYRITLEMPTERVGQSARLSRRSTADEEDEDYFELMGTVGADGRLVFSHVPAGSYSLDEMEFDVTGNATLAYREAQITGLEVEIWDPAGKLASWGFQSGDHVIAVNGQEFDFQNPQQMDRVFRSLFRTGSVEVSILRGGRPVTLSVVNDSATDWSALGGGLNPVRER
ncbi:MAG: hypothetical protein AB7O52_17895 [Planctomycetota bacterium]